MLNLLPCGRAAQGRGARRPARAVALRPRALCRRRRLRRGGVPHALAPVLSVRVERDPASAANLYLRGQKDVARFVRELRAPARPGPRRRRRGTQAERRGMTAGEERDLALGVIGNCAFNALIDARGRIVWCCLPRPDGDPVFNALLAGGGAPTRGAFAIELEGLAASRQSYVANTAILQTELVDDAGQRGAHHRLRAALSRTADGRSGHCCWCGGSSPSQGARGFASCSRRPSTTAGPSRCSRAAATTSATCTRRRRCG